MNDYRNLKILGVINLIDEIHLENAGIERKKFEEQKLRGKLGHIDVNISGKDYELILLKEVQEINNALSFKGKEAELFYVGLKQKKVKPVKRQKRSKDENPKD